MAEVKKLSKHDVRMCYLNWTMFSHSCYNYERLQATSFAEAMGVILKKLYPNKEDLGREMGKHFVFFNTEPNTGGVIHGVVIAMEEQRANGAPISEDMINGIKTGLMGPFAGVGDSIVQGIITPVLLAVALGMSQNADGSGNPVGPIFYIVVECVVILAWGYSMFMYGYRLGTAAIEKLLAGGMVNKVMQFAGILGCMVLGGLVSNFINITCGLSLVTEAGTFIIQTSLFDAILPNLLSVLGVLTVFTMLKKGVSSNKIILILFVAGIILGNPWFPILGPVPAVPAA